MNAAPGRKTERVVWIYAALFAVTLSVYFQATRFAFVNFDDPEYIGRNAHVREGLTFKSITWAFTSGEGANWFPLTRLSHLLDAQLFGLDSGWHHLTNVLIHEAAVLLLFAFLFRATKAQWPSAFVAFVFALHPLHVESVAWVSERKDVLCAFFWFLTLYLYVRYTEQPRAARYCLVLLSFACGLMSKPMIVTLPFVLPLLDRWPLRRTPKRPFAEKIPFVALAVLASLVTYLVQQASGAVKTFASLPLELRVENALVSYVIYLRETVWPEGLAVFYPHSAQFPVWEPALAGLLLLAVSIAVVRFRRVYPWLAAGWFWFVLTLLPVIGLIQVGAQAHADRYMYVPMVGLAIAAAWAGAEFIPRREALWLAGAVCIGLSALTWIQLQYWRNSEALFTHAIAVTRDNYLAQHNLGSALLEYPARLPEAVSHLEEALRIDPDSATAHTDLGSAFARMPGRLNDAVIQYRAALAIAPGAAIPHNNLANTLAQLPGRMPEAIAEYQAALRIDPDYTEARNNLAASQDSADAYYNNAMALARSGERVSEAVAQFKEAIRMRPDYAEAHNNLGVVLSKAGDSPGEPIAEFRSALRIRPDYAEAHYNLGVALANTPGHMPEAIRELETAQRLQPDAELKQLLERLHAK